MNKIRELRLKSKITQTELSQKLNISRTAVGKWEKGQAFPRAKLIPKVASILNCKIDDLFCHKE